MDQNAEMSSRIEGFDWSSTSLGPCDRWPASLRLMVNIALKTRFPMLVFWGPDLIQTYNDAFVPILGGKHPSALGQHARDCWPEIWSQIGPLLTRALESGEPAWGEDMPFVLERNGVPEQTYFTFSYSRIGAGDEAGGVLCTCVETTASVMREAQFRTMANNLNIIVFSYASDGRVEWANSHWLEYTKLPADIATRMSGWTQVIPQADIETVLELAAQGLATGESYEAEIRIKPYGGDDDAYRWHHVRAVPIRESNGAIERWAGSATDIHDRRLAQDVIRAQLDREHRASLAFQTAALPRHFPTVPNVKFDAVYQAAGEQSLVGGDWYDAFPLSNGRVIVSVGDVTGNGLDAAVIMAGVRQSIRGAAQVSPEPVAILRAADRALRAEHPGNIVSAFVGILDPLTREFTFASAGHPPPLLRHPDGLVTELVANDRPLGLRDERIEKAAATVDLPEGSMLLLHTDGLTESTHDILAGEQKLRDVLARDETYASEFPAAAIRDAMLDVAVDDVAILTIAIAKQRERRKS
jgi:PAS domain S-box-containing protein